MQDALRSGLWSPNTMMSQTPKLCFEDLRRLTDLIYERTGLRFGPKRFGPLRACILRRMAELGHRCLEEYIAYANEPDHILELKKTADILVSGEGI